MKIYPLPPCRLCYRVRQWTFTTFNRDNLFDTARRCAEMDNDYLVRNNEIGEYVRFFKLVWGLANSIGQFRLAILLKTGNDNISNST